MHLAGDGRGVRHAGGLKDGQRIHVGTQPDGLAAVAASAGDVPEHACAAGEIGLELDACVLQFALHDLARAVLLVADLRMRMQVAADVDQVRHFTRDGFAQRAGINGRHGSHGLSD